MIFLVDCVINLSNNLDQDDKHLARTLKSWTHIYLNGRTFTVTLKFLCVLKSSTCTIGNKRYRFYRFLPNRLSRDYWIGEFIDIFLIHSSLYTAAHRIQFCVGQFSEVSWTHHSSIHLGSTEFRWSYRSLFDVRSIHWSALQCSAAEWNQITLGYKGKCGEADLQWPK